MFIDKSSIEVFINGGREVMSMTIFPLKAVYEYAIGVNGKVTINELQHSSIHVGE
ncbi:GH32 C-terminal domain-containing protein [Carnobacterium jeotgali]|uniref:GH32 C-terminal domain-containing protein n=1 Tax=Carnobacterium jeotgali TaxID=545534 RepID=UPI0038902ACE